MMKKLSKKVAIVLGLFLLAGGVAYAAFTYNYDLTKGNTVTSASAGIKVTSSVINVEGLVGGQTSDESPLVVENVGGYAGNVKLNITNKNGNLCGNLTLNISGDKTANLSPIANGSINLGNLAPGQTLNLTQSVTMNTAPAMLGSGCTWDTTATFSDQ